MSSFQPGILLPIPPVARYTSYTLVPGANPRKLLAALGSAADGESTVVGIGLSLVSALERGIDELRSFPEFSGYGVDVPSTPAALWLWLRDDDRGNIVNRQRVLDECLAPAFNPAQVVEAFTYGAGLDLTGYEDGTENPKKAKAIATAISKRRGIAGSSFVAVQQWLHDMHRFDAMPGREQNHTFGRRKSDNEEIDNAPESAHVKRTAQESFDPEAFVVRRSMPWSDGPRCGLVFTAFGATFDPFEALLRRMVGAEDGITDALFRFTRPLSGAYFWCPPVKGRKIDLSALGI